jgi:hypothetical protein
VSDQDAGRDRWWHLTLAEQFGNVGSEISRAIRWQTKNPETARAALYRGLDLFDLMLDDPRHRTSVARLREIARAREVVVDFLAGANEYRSTGPSLQKYFDQFALAARRVHLAGRAFER